jgi:TonB family protein
MPTAIDRNQVKTDVTTLTSPLGKLADLLQSAPQLRAVADAARRVTEDSATPLMVVIIGQFKTGKSTFVNALLGENLLTTDVLPSTAAVTVLRFGSVRSLVAHSQDGSSRAFDLRDLALLSAEGDAVGAAVRRNLSWLEVRLPSPILNHICLVDTPGLNSTNPMHTEATRSFMSRADAVLWVTSALQAGSRDELKQLSMLPEGLQPHAIINQIDQLDEEEQSIKGFLDHHASTLKRHVKSVIGVSARGAIDAREHSDRQALIKSLWPELLDHLNDAVVGQAAQLKAERTLDRVIDLISLVRDKTAEILAERTRACSLIGKLEREMMTLVERTDALLATASDWTTNDGEVACKFVAENQVINHHVLEAPDLNDQLRQISRPARDLLRMSDDILACENVFGVQYADLKNRRKQLDDDMAVFNKSGLFGGPPIFDGGERDRLNARIYSLNREFDQFKIEVDRHNQNDAVLGSAINDLAPRALMLCGRIVSALQRTVEEMHVQLESAQSEQRQALLVLENTEWASKLGTMLQGALNEIWRIVEALPVADAKRRVFEKILQSAISVASHLESTSNAAASAQITPIPVRFSRKEERSAAPEPVIQSAKPSAARSRPTAIWVSAALILLGTLVYFGLIAPHQQSSSSETSEAVERASWDQADDQNTEEALKTYLNAFPAGSHHDRAQKRLDQLQALAKTSAQNALAAAAAVPSSGVGGGSGGEVYSLGGEVSNPILVSKEEPACSYEGRRAKYSDVVQFSAVIDENGIPTNIQVTAPLGLRLDDKAMQAVEHWRFSPGLKDGKPVKVKASIEVSFRLLDTGPTDAQTDAANIGNQTALAEACFVEIKP